MTLSKQNLIYLQDELNRRLKLFVGTPFNEIEYVFFQKIHDYVDWIVKNKTLQNILEEHITHCPFDTLYNQGKNITKIHYSLLFKRASKEASNIDIAYMALWGAYLGVKDLEADLDKKTDKNNPYQGKLYLGNRIKTVQCLRRFNSPFPNFGYNIFTFYRHFFNGWSRIINEKLLFELSYKIIEAGQKEEELTEDERKKLQEYRLEKAKRAEEYQRQKIELAKKQKPQVVIPKIDIGIELKKSKDLAEENNKNKKVNSKISKRLGITKDTKWEDITFKFINEYDIEISYDNAKVKTDYKELGFADMRKEKAGITKAVEAYEFLQIISANNGHYPLSGTEGKERKKALQNRKDLQKILKTIFRPIKTSPFKNLNNFKLKNADYYLRLKLIPHPHFRDDFTDTRKKIFDEEAMKELKNDPYGIEDSYKEQTPNLEQKKSYLPDF